MWPKCLKLWLFDIDKLWQFDIDTLWQFDIDEKDKTLLTDAATKILNKIQIFPQVLNLG